MVFDSLDEVTDNDNGNMVIKIGDQTVTIQHFQLYNSISNTLIQGSTYTDSIDNTGSNVTIKGGEGNDYIG